MRVRHPNAVAGESVDVDGDLRPVEDDTFEVHDDETSWLQRWCEANGYDPDEVVVQASVINANPTPDADGSGTCQEVKNDGEVCGRDLPCPYHSEED